MVIADRDAKAAAAGRAEMQKKGHLVEIVDMDVTNSAGVTEAAEQMGLSSDARAGLRRRLTLDDVNEAAYALRCDLPAAATETLLIVDQFDELLTETPEASCAPPIRDNPVAKNQLKRYPEVFNQPFFIQKNSRA